MTNLTPQEREALLSRVSPVCKIVGCAKDHPIMIGDVLEKMAEWQCCEKIPQDSHLAHLMNLFTRWQPCGFTKSLQYINEDVENIVWAKPNPDGTMQAVENSREVLKPSAMALMVFINEVI